MNLIFHQKFLTSSNINNYFQVRNRYAEQYEYEAISNLLGMEKSDTITIDKDEGSGFFK